MLVQNIKFKEDLEYPLIQTPIKELKSGYYYFSDILTGKSTILNCFVLNKSESLQPSSILPIKYQSFFGYGSHKKSYIKVKSIETTSLEDAVCRIMLKEAYSEKNPNISIRHSDLNHFLYEMAQAVSLTDAIQNFIDIEDYALMAGSYININVLNWNLVFKVQMISNEDQTIQYRNVAIKCDTFRFLINYFVLRPNLVKTLSSLALPQSSSALKAFKSFLIKEASEPGSIVFEGSPFIKLMKLIKLMRQGIRLSEIPNVVTYHAINDISDPDAVIQTVLKNYHKENQDVVRMMSIESFDINSKENGVNLLAVFKAKEAFKANKKNFFVVHFTKMGDLKNRDEFITYCVKEFESISNAIFILTNLVNPEDKLAKSMKLDNNLWNIDLKMNLKRTKALIRDYLF